MWHVKKLFTGSLTVQKLACFHMKCTFIAVGAYNHTKVFIIKTITVLLTSRMISFIWHRKHASAGATRTRRIRFPVWLGTYEAVNAIARRSPREDNYRNLFLKRTPPPQLCGDFLIYSRWCVLSVRRYGLKTHIHINREGEESH